jgi:hypothetical protein
MNRDKIVKAFDEFVDEKYADSEETLRGELRQAVNDFLKNKLELDADPIQSVVDDTDDAGAGGDASDNEGEEQED